MMKIQTYSILAGTKACNACCPYCVSKMTPSFGVSQEGSEVRWASKKEESEINWNNFRVGCKFATKSGVSTVLITGKGEPTLCPYQINDYLRTGRYRDYSLKDRLGMFFDYLKYASEYKIKFTNIKGHAIRFTKGLKDATKLRVDITSAKKLDDLEKTMHQAFSKA